MLDILYIYYTQTQYKSAIENTVSVFECDYNLLE